MRRPKEKEKEKEKRRKKRQCVMMTYIDKFFFNLNKSSNKKKSCTHAEKKYIYNKNRMIRERKGRWMTYYIRVKMLFDGWNSKKRTLKGNAHVASLPFLSWHSIFIISLSSKESNKDEMTYINLCDKISVNIFFIFWRR